MKLVERVPSGLLDAVNRFSMRIEWARRLPIYEVHKWWARRYAGIVRIFLAFNELDQSVLKGVANYDEFVRKTYYDPPRVSGKRLLDPFCGGGTIILEASRLGYEAHGIEINRLAVLALNVVSWLQSINTHLIEKRILEAFNSVRCIWETSCRSGHSALVIHTFLAWRDGKGNLQVGRNKIKDGAEKVYYCEVCKGLFESFEELKACPNCGNRFNKPLKRLERVQVSPFAIEYYCQVCGKRELKAADSVDHEKFYLRGVRRELFRIPVLTETRRLVRAGLTDFGELLTPRQLYTFNNLLSLFPEEPYRSVMKLLVSDSVRSCSLLAYYSEKYRKVIPGLVIKSYWLPSQPVELNPLSFYIEGGVMKPLGRGNVVSALRKLERAKRHIEKEPLGKFKVYYGPAQDVLENLEGEYQIVFTDPPYGDYQFYSDLSLLGLSVIRELNQEMLDTLIEKELTVRGPEQLGKYLNGLRQTFSAAARRLSEDGRIMMTFHHHDLGFILSVIRVFKDLKLNLLSVYPIIGESSGKLSRRKVYLDLLFVFGRRKSEPHYCTTSYGFTEHDFKLQASIPKIIEFYKNHQGVSNVD